MFSDGGIENFGMKAKRAMVQRCPKGASKECGAMRNIQVPGWRPLSRDTNKWARMRDFTVPSGMPSLNHGLLRDFLRRPHRRRKATGRRP